MGMRVGFFFNDAATTEIYTLSLRDALPICQPEAAECADLLASIADIGQQVPGIVGEESGRLVCYAGNRRLYCCRVLGIRSEEHTSELQSCQYLVCRLLLEKNTPALLTVMLP